VNYYSRHAGWGRGDYIHLDEGKLKVKDINGSKTVVVKRGTIRQVITVTGNEKTDMAYGRHLKEYKDGKIKIHVNYHPGTNYSMHGKCYWRDETLLENKGTRRQEYSKGTLKREYFTYLNGQRMYDITRYSCKPLVIKYPDNQLALCITSEVKKPLLKWAWSKQVISANVIPSLFGEDRWRYGLAVDNAHIEAHSPTGQIQFEGEIKNRQRVGEWTLPTGKVWYLQGVKVSYKVFSTPPEKLDIMEILGIENAQLRSAMLSKYSTQGMFDKLRAEGVQVKEQVEGNMKLFTIPVAKVPEGATTANRDAVIKFLEVTCPSTKAKYMLKVPPQTNTCEEGRQWTFGKDFVTRDQAIQIPKEEYIEFAQET